MDIHRERITPYHHAKIQRLHLNTPILVNSQWKLVGKFDMRNCTFWGGRVAKGVIPQPEGHKVPSDSLCACLCQSVQGTEPTCSRAANWLTLAKNISLTENIAVSVDSCSVACYLPLHCFLNKTKMVLFLVQSPCPEFTSLVFILPTSCWSWQTTLLPSDKAVKGLVHSSVKSPTRGKSLVFISNFQEFLMKCCEIVICPFARQAKFVVCFLMREAKCVLTQPRVWVRSLSLGKWGRRRNLSITFIIKDKLLVIFIYTFNQIEFNKAWKLGDGSPYLPSSWWL